MLLRSANSSAVKLVAKLDLSFSMGLPIVACNKRTMDAAFGNAAYQVYQPHVPTLLMGRLNAGRAVRLRISSIPVI
jgi:hypothetical protein